MVQAAVPATDHILGGGLQSSGHGAREPLFDLDADAPRAGPWDLGQSSALPQFQATIRFDAQHAPSKEGVRIWGVGLAGGCALKQQDLLDPCTDLLPMVGAMEATTRMERAYFRKNVMLLQSLLAKLVLALALLRRICWPFGALASK